MLKTRDPVITVVVQADAAIQKIWQLRQAVLGLNTAVSMVSQSGTDMASNLEGIEKTASKVQKSTSDVAISSLAMGYWFIRVSDNLKDITRSLVQFSTFSIMAADRLNMMTRALSAMAGSAQESNELVQAWRDLAKLPAFSIETAFQGIARVKDFFPNIEMMKAALTGLSYTVSAFAGTETETARVILAISQMIQQGRFGGQEIRQMANALIPVRGLLRDVTGLTEEQMEKIGQTTEGATWLINQFIGALLTNEQLMLRGAQAQNTLANAIVNVKDAATLAAASLMGPWLQAVTGAVNELAQWLESLATKPYSSGIGLLGMALAAATAIVAAYYSARAAVILYTAAMVSARNVIAQTTAATVAETAATEAAGTATEAATAATVAETAATEAVTAATVTETAATEAATAATVAETAATEAATAATEVSATAMKGAIGVTIAWRMALLSLARGLLWIAAIATAIGIAVKLAIDYIPGAKEAFESLIEKGREFLNIPRRETWKDWQERLEAEFQRYETARKFTRESGINIMRYYLKDFGDIARQLNDIAKYFGVGIQPAFGKLPYFRLIAVNWISAVYDALSNQKLSVDEQMDLMKSIGNVIDMFNTIYQDELDSLKTNVENMDAFAEALEAMGYSVQEIAHWQWKNVTGRIQKFLPAYKEAIKDLEEAYRISGRPEDLIAAYKLVRQYYEWDRKLLEEERRRNQEKAEWRREQYNALQQQKQEMDRFDIGQRLLGIGKESEFLPGLLAFSHRLGGYVARPVDTWANVFRRQGKRVGEQIADTVETLLETHDRELITALGKRLLGQRAGRQ